MAKMSRNAARDYLELMIKNKAINEGHIQADDYNPNLVPAEESPNGFSHEETVWVNFGKDVISEAKRDWTETFGTMNMTDNEIASNLNKSLSNFISEILTKAGL